MVTEAERQALINEGEIVIKTGEQWYAKLGSELEKKFPAGYFVIINIENGDYVVDEDEIVASQKARKVFPPEARRFIRKIVGPYPHVEFAGCLR